MPATPHTTPAHGAQSRERILEAAERLMSERGFAGTSISAIRRASGLPASSIYWHFESKEGLLAAVMERGAEAWLARLRESGEPELGRLMSLAMPDLGRRPTEFLRLLILLALERRGADAQTLETIRRVRARAQQLLEAAIAETFRDEGEERARAVARECAGFAQSFGDGLVVAQQIDADVDLDRLASQFQIAIRAIARACLDADGAAGSDG